MQTANKNNTIIYLSIVLYMTRVVGIGRAFPHFPAQREIQGLRSADRRDLFDPCEMFCALVMHFSHFKQIFRYYMNDIRTYVV